MSDKDGSNSNLPGKEADGTISTERLAGFIVDALLTAGLLSEANLDLAQEIVEEEINVRKAIGTY